MYNIEWDDSISVGIPVIDEDHRKLVEILNELFAACFAAQGPEVLEEIVERLTDYTKYHFEREESLLAKAEYEGLETHKAGHVKLVGRVEKIQSELRSAATHDLSNDTLGLLSHWLTDHIKMEIKEYGALLRAKNIE